MLHAINCKITTIRTFKKKVLMIKNQISERYKCTQCVFMIILTFIGKFIQFRAANVKNTRGLI